jgi:hypothetical protein
MMREEKRVKDIEEKKGDKELLKECIGILLIIKAKSDCCPEKTPEKTLKTRRRIFKIRNYYASC